MGAKNNNDDSGIFEINVTPLVDITLVLLIIFMVTATFIVSPVVKVELPKAASKDNLQQDKPTLSIYLAKDGTIALAGITKEFAEGKDSIIIQPSMLKDWVERIKDAHPNVQVAIQADKHVPFGKVMGVVDIVKQAGISNFAFNVDPNSTDMLLEDSK